MTFFLNNEEIGIRPNRLYEIILREWKKVKIKPKYIMIDLSSPPGALIRGSLFNYLALAIQNIVTESDKNLLKCIVLVGSMPHEKDFFMAEIINMGLEDKIIVVDRKGRCYPESVCRNDITSVEARLRDLSQDTFVEFKKKIIRRWGHFRKPGRGGKDLGCYRYYFDASFCGEELLALLNEHEITNKIDYDAIIYYAPHSPWLPETVRRLAAHRKIKCFDYNEEDDIKKLRKASKGPLMLLLILPMINSARTFSQLIESIRGLSEEGVLNTLSVFSTVYVDKKNNIFKVTIKNEEYVINYLHLVKNPIINDCILCETQIKPFAMDGKDIFLQLSAVDFWDMSDESKWSLERPRPPYRKSIDVLPDFEKMVKNNGPWLASKVPDLLFQEIEKRPTDVIIVCPKERGANALADLLESIYKFSIIKIPRRIINKNIKGAKTKELEGIQKRSKSKIPIWYHQLKTMHAEAIIVLDEFIASGNTMSGMTNIINYFQKEVTCYLSLADFSPDTGVNVNDEYKKICFYAFNAQIENKDVVV